MDIIIKDGSQQNSHKSLKLEEKKTKTIINYHYIPEWVGEGNGTPLQYSYLENPMNGGAW